MDTATTNTRVRILTDADVRAIRKLSMSKWPRRQIAKAFGIKESTVTAIARRHRKAQVSDRGPVADVPPQPR